MLDERLVRMETIGELLKKRGNEDGKYMIIECELIMEGKLNLENTFLKQKIVEMLYDANMKSLGYSIYRSVWTKYLFDFYMSSEKTDALIKLFDEMKSLTQINSVMFDFTQNDWAKERAFTASREGNNRKST